MADELEIYLEKLRGEGRSDSSGRFTLDRFRAQALLGHFQKGNPRHYLFHIVRAGVAARSQQIQVHSQADRLEVRFEGPAPVAFEHRLMKAVESPWGLPQGTPLAHLARGLLACAELGPHRLEWNTWDGQRGSSLLWDENGLRVVSLERSPWVAPQSGFSLVLLGGSRDSGLELSALRSDYGFTNIPLRLGKDVCAPRGWIDESLGAGNDLRLPRGFRLAEAYGPPGPRQQLSLPVSQERACVLLTEGPKGLLETFDHNWQAGPATPLILYLPPTIAKGSASAVAVCWHLQGEGQVVWIQNGLRLSQLHLDMACPGAVAVSEVDGLTLDAGGTQIVDDRVYRNRVRDLRESIKTLWPMIPKYLPFLRAPNPPDKGLLNRLFSNERRLSAQDKELQAYVRQNLPRYQL
ncbi:MAG: hypothetical protein U0931_05380 [Vulcanimicrobiota bacterium]